MSKDNILFIIEGEKTENQLVQNIRKIFGDEGINNIIPFCSNIYSLYDLLKKYDFEANILELLSETHPEKTQHIQLDKISNIFLFFDYDKQDGHSADYKLKQLLDHFDNETEDGKLYISYPMVEAVKMAPVNRNCKSNCVFPILKLKQYKKEVNKKITNKDATKYSDILKFSRHIWFELIYHNLCKVNCIIFDKYEIPKYEDYKCIFQKAILEGQEKKFLHKNKICVLSPFPLFILDYFGENLYDELIYDINNENIKNIDKHPNCPY